MASVPSRYVWFPAVCAALLLGCGGALELEEEALATSDDALASCSGSYTWAGALSGPASVTHTFLVSTGDTAFMDAVLRWGGTKNLRMTVVDPTGQRTLVDHPHGNVEWYHQSAPLPQGEWQLVIETDAKGKTAYCAFVQLTAPAS